MKSLKRPDELFAKPITRKELVAVLAFMEGKKHETAVGDIREIVSLLAKIEYASYMYDGRYRLQEWLMAEVHSKATKKK